MIWLHAAGNRLRHDLGRELVVGVSALVLLATFLYVFNDFLNVQVASLSQAMRDRFADAATVVVLGLAAAVAARGLRAERAPERGVRRTGQSLGETPGVLRTFLALHDVTVVGVAHGVGWWLTLRYLHRGSQQEWVRWEAALLLVTAALAALAALPVRPFLLQSFFSSLTPGRPAALSKKERRTEKPVFALTRWRARQVLFRNRLTRLCLVLALPFALAAALAAFRGAPPFVAATAALAAGYLAAAALCFQLADDLTHVWAERGFGVTHDQFVQAYERLGVGLGLAVGLVTAVLVLSAAAAGGGLSLPMLGVTAKVLALGALPPVLMPLLMLQIDGRRAGVTLLLTLIASLFIGTAVLAHWLGLLLVPLLRYYALRSQTGRFYRA